jgi:SHAQKYF class myb-like DNA-binding protein
MPKGSSNNNNRRFTSTKRMEDNEPYLDLTYGTGGEQQYSTEQDDRDHDDDNVDDGDYYYNEVVQHQQQQSQHGFGSNLFQQGDNHNNNNLIGMMNGDDDVDMNNNYEMDNDDDMEQDPNGMNNNNNNNYQNNHHEELFHYDHHPIQHVPPPPPAPLPPNMSQGSGHTSSVVAEEHTGRWTKEEHEAFLQGLQLYGKEWKKVAAKVRTRTVVQTRTHAQKYFQKLQKSIQDNVSNKRRTIGNSSTSSNNNYDMRDEPNDDHDDETKRMIAIMNSTNPNNEEDDDDGGGGGEEEDGFAASTTILSTSTRGRNSRSTGSTNTRGRGGRRGASSSSTTTYTNNFGRFHNNNNNSKISIAKKAIGQQPLQQQPLLLPPPPVTAMKMMKNNTITTMTTPSSSHQSRRGSTATLNAAQVISTLSSAKTGINNMTTSSSSSSSSRIPQQSQQQQNVVTTTVHNIHTTPSRVEHKNYLPSSNNSTTSLSSSSNMKIIAPDPSRMGRHYAFPEPSPAATGKRKLAEIAAAQMLAGVISSSSSSKIAALSTMPNSMNRNNPNTTGSSTAIDFAISDGPPTPPMSTSYIGESSTTSVQQQRPLDLNEAPPLPPLFSSSNNNSISTNKPTLHIVNPDLFGIAPTMHKNNDPVTPWENELAALIDSTSNTTSLNDLDDGEIDINDMLNTAMDVLDTSTILQSQILSQEEEQQQYQYQQQPQQQQYMHSIHGPVDGFLRTPLHQAVCAQDDETVQTLLDVIGTQSKDLNQYDTAGYTPLHSACAAAFARSSIDEDKNDNMKPNHIVRMLLQAGCNPYLYDSNGNTPLHWSVRACDYDATQQLIHHIISNNTIHKTTDDDNNNTDVTNVLTTMNASSNRTTIEQYVNIQNQLGETCMHWTARGGIRCCDPIAVLLLSHSASTDIVNKALKRPIDVAADGYMDEPYSVEFIRNKHQSSIKNTNQTNNGDGHKKKTCNSNKELNDAIQRTIQDRCSTRAFLLRHSKSLRTLVLHHPECLDHHPKSISDWETPDRVKTILQRLESNTSSTIESGISTDKDNNAILLDEIVLSQDFDRGNLELLSRVHSTEYLSFVNQLSKDLERKLASQGNNTYHDNDGITDTKSMNNITKWGLQISSSSLPVVPFTPMVQRTMIKVDESNVKLSDNSDTSFSVGSLRAARRAAGAVQHAIDWYVSYIFSCCCDNGICCNISIDITSIFYSIRILSKCINGEESKCILYCTSTRTSRWC